MTRKIGFSAAEAAKSRQVLEEQFARKDRWGARRFMPTPEMAVTRHWPSVLRQTHWPCGMFHFGKAESPGVVYFNPGLLERSDGLWLLARRSENKPGLSIGMNSLMAFKLSEKLIPQYGITVKMLARFPGEHFEDARVIAFNNAPLVSCSNFIVFPRKPKEVWTGSQITVQPLNSRWESTNRFDPIYGNNAKVGRNGNDIEKNWLWFMHPDWPDKPHLVYQAKPHTVIRFNNQFVREEAWETDKTLNWRYGVVRGGTPPVLVGKEWWTFFHSSLPLDTKYRRRYFMGAYAFWHEPPFHITRMTREPLLAGSDEDPWAEEKPLVIFPCGSRFENWTWLVTCGINDLKCFWVRIPHEAVINAAKSL